MALCGASGTFFHSGALLVAIRHELVAIRHRLVAIRHGLVSIRHGLVAIRHGLAAIRHALVAIRTKARLAANPDVLSEKDAAVLMGLQSPAHRLAAAAESPNGSPGDHNLNDLQLGAA
ncbi:hypothetical protein PtA15_6A628 [Puccinia triticina]|uniref:Transposase n=1 Tax=Puccinia triticina TaxID=208348 RepID=A0ABY7CM38_9BASI|nr:uncharacterized protein PtA15_6A628 [Puccinia triticina]WAQ85998.1 hypothetical protein PtA15_6A628 [Puccinia triticina]